MNSTLSPSIPKSAATQPADSERRTTLRRAWRALWLLALLFILYKVSFVGYYSWTTYSSLKTIQQQLISAPQLASLPLVQPQLRQLAGGMAGLESHLRIFAPVLRLLRFVPVYGPTIAAAPELLIVGRELTAVAEQGGQLAATATQSGTLSSASVITLVAQNGERLAQMGERTQVAELALRGVPVDQLHPALRDRLELAQSLLPAAAAGMQIAPLAPLLLGMEQPRTWLLLVQNNHELRSTGGFISAVAQVTLDHGQLGALDFTDSYNIYDATGNNQGYPRAPAPMAKHMGIPILLFRDANWSPDLPTTAQTARALYLKDTGVAVDGIVTVDLNAAQRLIGALGALQVAGADQPVTGDNLIEQLKSFWEKPTAAQDSVSAEPVGDWWARRKDFMPELAKAVMARLQAGDLDYATLLQAGVTALNRRDVQIWSDEAKVAEVLQTLGWDGGLRPEAETDFLALVDTNMGYNKVDAVLKRGLDYQVTWPQGNAGPAQATVSIVYEHPLTAAPGEEKCDQTPRYGTSYDEMAARCYFDFVRLYVPSGSQLISSEGLQPGSEVQQRGEKGTQVFGGFFVLRPTERHIIKFVYTLPPSLTPSNYALIVQRQSGLSKLPIALEINGRAFETELVDGVLRFE